MLALLKTSLHINIDLLDEELEMNIEAGKADLGIAGVLDIDDPLWKKAVLTYAQYMYWLSRDPARAERMLTAYNMQKAQLQMASGYTEWGDESDV